MTTAIMEFLKDCKNKGMFNSSKKKDYTPVWVEVKDFCADKWSSMPWTVGTISSKVYKTVFWREHATGDLIAETGESQGGATQADNDEDSGHDNPDLLDDESDTESDEGSDVGGDSQAQEDANSAPRRRLTAAQQHRIDTDPDLTELAPEDRSNTVATRQRKKPQTEASILDHGLSTAAETLAAPKLPGARDLQDTLKDL
ncbi:hypothetical protein B0T25DRAFT_563637 [Lasiosphaeria hispida]|uniref:No apical meristem-associated C-terminal domain-containing protein n=1 Tax=Lasiosphaeria hispida TaxID=260671 RepID=A0AAJ0HXH3_9PEZI|nr:hypothetical protein B0T25DRAFT_563637 [Lasiosphaeria hispida]